MPPKAAAITVLATTRAKSGVPAVVEPPLKPIHPTSRTIAPPAERTVE